MDLKLSLDDRRYVEIFIGDRVLREDIFNSKGNIPVFSANVYKPFGYLTKSNIADFAHNYLLWGIDGKFEFNIMRKGIKFATTDHCGAIRILNDKILPEYLSHELVLKSRILGYDRTLRPSLTLMGKVTVNIPTTADGEFDVKKQEAIAKKYRKITLMKEKIGQTLEKIDEISVEIIQSGTSKLRVDEIFDFPPTNSGITKELCEKNKGNIPVYGCSNSESNVLGYIKDNFNGVKYYENCLTWNRNGAVDKVFYRGGRFTTNEDHRVLTIKPKYAKKVDLLYIRYVLENEIKRRGYGFTNKLGKRRISEIEVEVPVDKKYEVSLNDQIKIREQYEKIKSLKQKLVQNLNKLNEAYVQISK